MAESAAKTKAPSNIKDISSEDMQTFIDVLNTLALGPMYTSSGVDRSGDYRTFSYTRPGGGGTGPKQYSSSYKASEPEAAVNTLNKMMQRDIPSLPEYDIKTSRTEKPGINLQDFVDVLNTLNVKSDAGVPRSASMSDPQQPSLAPYTALAFGKTPTEKSESLNDQISQILQSLLYLRGSKGSSK